MTIIFDLYRTLLKDKKALEHSSILVRPSLP
jgi:hypothetical protein